MSPSLNLIESLARDCHAERYRDSRSRGRTPTRAMAFRRAGAMASGHAVETRPLETTRHRAGWLLVGLGMRLLAGRGRPATRGARLIGQ